METNKTKYQIAKMITSGCWIDNPTYENLLETIYENEYRILSKIPIKVFMEGLVSSFVVKSLEHANKLLSSVKEVVQEALETSGIELTYTDEDWHNLKFVENTGWNKEKHPYKLSKLSKGYMSEFFET